MIESLYINNFALIDELEVQFRKGFNVLTGQTGAGKSIIVGALNMILGERADTDVIRQGHSKAVAEAVISIGDNPQLHRLLEKNQVEFDSRLVLRREIRDTGSRAFINDSPVTIAVLKEIGDQLVDLHGQHDHQLLLNEDYHQAVLDMYGKTTEALNAYRQAYSESDRLRGELRDLHNRERDLREKTELYRFQLREIDQANLNSAEEEDIETEMNRLDNAEELDQKASFIVDRGTDGEINVMDLLNSIEKTLEDIASMDPSFESYLKEINSARISLQELFSYTDRYRTQIEFNPQRLEFLRRRQSDINKLRKKYNRNVSGLLQYADELRQQLNLADNFDVEIERLAGKITVQDKELSDKALKLFELRKNAGINLKNAILKELDKLGMPDSQFMVRQEIREDPQGWIQFGGKQVQGTVDGIDRVSFYISTNKGEEPKPLSKIASGGEISRIMLAIKSIIAREQSLPVMIFDEIDTGISGAVSERVGSILRSLSDHCQIITITHQPQIASQAAHHYKVEKRQTGGRTTTHIMALNDDEHIREIASLMSGTQITTAALESARQLIAQSQKPG